MSQNDYITQAINMARFGLPKLHERAPSTPGFNRYTKLMSPETRSLVLKSLATEIEAFAEDRGYQPTMITGIAEAVMRLGRVPELEQYGFAGDDAAAIKHFMAAEILNIAIEHRVPIGPCISGDSPSAREPVVESAPDVSPVDKMLLGSAFMTRGNVLGTSRYLKLAEEQRALKVMPQIGCRPTESPALTMEDIQLLNEGLDGKAKKGTKLSKKLRGDGKAITSPAERVPGEFDCASGGTAGPAMTTDTVVSKRIREGDAQDFDLAEGAKRNLRVAKAGIKKHGQKWAAGAAGDDERGRLRKSQSQAQSSEERGKRYHAKVRADNEGRPTIDESDVIRWIPGQGLVVEGDKLTRKERSKQNKERFAKLSPEAKAKTQGNAPFHPSLK